MVRAPRSTRTATTSSASRWSPATAPANHTPLIIDGRIVSVTGSKLWGDERQFVAAAAGFTPLASQPQAQHARLGPKSRSAAAQASRTLARSLRQVQGTQALTRTGRPIRETARHD